MTFYRMTGSIIKKRLWQSTAMETPKYIRRAHSFPQSPYRHRHRLRLQRLCWRGLCIAANDLNLVRRDRLAIVVHLERNVLDEEGPNLVAEPIGI
jgi:hypothetical protein